jgi:hypothetical protein
MLCLGKGLKLTERQGYFHADLNLSYLVYHLLQGEEFW